MRKSGSLSARPPLPGSSRSVCCWPLPPPTAAPDGQGYVDPPPGAPAGHRGHLRATDTLPVAIRRTSAGDDRASRPGSPTARSWSSPPRPPATLRRQERWGDLHGDPQALSVTVGGDIFCTETWTDHMTAVSRRTLCAAAMPSTSTSRSPRVRSRQRDDHDHLRHVHPDHRVNSSASKTSGCAVAVIAHFLLFRYRCRLRSARARRNSSNAQRPTRDASRLCLTAVRHTVRGLMMSFITLCAIVAVARSTITFARGRP